MNRNMGRATQSRCAELPALILITALLALIATGRAGTVLAQNNPPPLPNPQAADPRPPISREAPIGHRQPRPQDLPPSVRREEGTINPAQRELDEKLQICRGC
jgi:hypothetical protein